MKKVKKKIIKKVSNFSISGYSLGDAWVDFQRDNDLKKLRNPRKHFLKIGRGKLKITLPVVDIRRKRRK